MNKLFKNEYIFSVFTKILMVFIGFAHSIVIARFLGADLKGVMTSVQSIVNIIAIIITFGIHEAYPFYRKKYGKEAFLSPYMTMVVTLHIIYLMVGLVAAIILRNYGFIVMFSCILAPISGYAIITGYVCLVEYPQQRNLAFLIITISETIFVGGLYIITKSNYQWLFVLLVFSDLLKSLYFTYKIKFKFYLKSLNRRFVMEIFKFGFFPMIALLMTSLNYKIDVIMLNLSNNVSMAQIGVYSIGVALADKTVYIPDAIKEILLSKLAKGKKEDEVARATRMCFPISIAMVIAIILMGAPLINTLYGGDYAGAYSVTIICVFGTAVMVFFKMISQYNVVNNKQILNVIMLSISVIINIILNIIFIPKYNIIGAAISSVIGYLVCATVFIIYFSKVSNISIRNVVMLNKEDISLITKFLKKKKNQDC